MMQNETVSERHLALLWHTLGVTPERREPYRNHFVADPGHYAMPDLQGLETEGLMARARTPAFCCPDDVVFIVTDAGRRLALRLLPEPPKQTRYDEYLCSEYSESFADYLGINVPEYETRGHFQRDTEYRMFRRGNSHLGEPWIYGEWARTKKEAKASYKAALKANWAARRSVA